MKPEILIRTDGNHHIGLGHIVRCIALAHMLKDDFEVTFFCKEIPEIIVVELNENNFRCIKIANENEFHGNITSDNIIVLDGYNFDSDYQKRIKTSGAKLICIDDLHNQEFVADLIINHAPGVTPHFYKTQPYTQFALGLDYTLLRPTFLEQAKKQRTIEKVENIMICFGGSDSFNLTQSLLQIVLEFSQFKKIIIVTGPAYMTTDRFKRMINSDVRIDYRHSLKEQQMLDTMLEADLAIVPASGILFEVLAAGCIVITGSYINNQDFILKGFSSLNLVEESVNLSNPRNALLKIINCTLPQRKSAIDGESKYRIICKIKELIK